MRTVAVFSRYTEKQQKLIQQRMKMEIKALNNAENKLKAELFRQVGIMSGCAAIALCENWGWKGKRVAKLFKEIQDAWEENSKDRDVSMIELCERETGIVIDVPGFDGDYKKLRYFNPNYTLDEMSIQEKTVMRIKQIQWSGPIVFASVIVALHRLYGFGGERIERLYNQMVEVRDRYGWNVKKIEKACYECTGVTMGVGD